MHFLAFLNNALGVIEPLRFLGDFFTFCDHCRDQIIELYRWVLLP